MTANKDKLIALHSALNANGAPGWLKELRSKGAEAFASSELPHGRIEEWRQTNINPIVNTDYNSLSGPGEQSIDETTLAPLFLNEEGMNELVFINGFYSPSSSKLAAQDGVQVGGLAEAIKSDNPVAKNYLGSQLREKGAYPQLNSALVQDGAFVHVARNTKAAAPIHLIFITTAHDQATAIHPRNLIVLDEGAEASIVCSYTGIADTGEYLNNVVTEIITGANAELNWCKVIQESATGNHLETNDIRLDRDARFHSYTFTLNGGIVRNKIATLLDGENASCNLAGVYCNDGDRLTDNFADITHSKPHCNSRMFYKGILDGKSKAVFTGKVYVDRVAQQTDSNQLSNNLMLSDDATIDAKPQLEIYADDVKCTHGATVGPAPEEIIFYFRSRGIDEDTARAMLTYGFADEIVDEIPVESLRKRLDTYIFDKYSPKRVANRI